VIPRKVHGVNCVVMKTLCMCKLLNVAFNCHINNLGNSQSACFERLEKLSDLNDSISNLDKSVHLIDDRHLKKVLYFNNLRVSTHNYTYRINLS
jgi:hypothetical protein